MSLHTSEGTIFSPCGAVIAGNEFAEALNQTSSSFSGPTQHLAEPNLLDFTHPPSNALPESRSIVTSRLIVKWGVPPYEDGEAV